MGYKKIKPTLENFSNLAFKWPGCGLHPDPDDDERWAHKCLSRSRYKDEKGRCSMSDCPLCNTVNLDDLREHDQHLYEEWVANVVGSGEKTEDFTGEESNDLNSWFGCDWVIQHSEVAK